MFENENETNGLLNGIENTVDNDVNNINDNNNKRNNNITRMLNGAIKTGNDIQEIGNNNIIDLEGQREHIIRLKKVNIGIQLKLYKNNGILNRMFVNSKKYKCISLAIILFIIISLIILIYLMFHN
jgi:hypothetical protein